jgi:hypothetical protein
MPRFLVRAALTGCPEAVIQAAMPDLQEQLAARPYLKNLRVTWNSDSRCIIVEVEDEAPTAQRARGGVYDEVFESACAVIGNFDRLRVEILGVTTPVRDENGRGA